jgi:hypothetical protein
MQSGRDLTADRFRRSSEWVGIKERFGSLIGDREPIVLHKEIPSIGRAKRYIITIADDDQPRWTNYVRS